MLRIYFLFISLKGISSGTCGMYSRIHPSNNNDSCYVLREKIGKEFVATPISLLHILCQLLFTKFLGLELTVRSKTFGPVYFHGAKIGFQTMLQA